MKVGVIVGRFQTPMLTRGHYHLIETVLSENDRVVIFVGTNIVRSKSNPFDFKTRKAMILGSAFSSHGWRDKIIYDNSRVTILPLPDMKLNEDWVKMLDVNIKRLTTNIKSVTLYGSRDSFLSTYTTNNGNYPSKVISEIEGVSATQVRLKYSKEILNNIDKRIGYLQAVYREYPAAYGVVDAIITDNDNNVLLGYKDNQGYCLFGGFIDAEDNSLEEAILREVQEEAGININRAIYMFSRKCNDWRYAKSIQPMSSIFHLKTTNEVMQKAIPGDDIDKVVIASLDEIDNYFLSRDTHLHYLKEFININK